MEIVRAPDGDIQHALAKAHENKLLPGNQILAIRRIILRCNQRRKSAPRKGRGVPHTGWVRWLRGPAGGRPVRLQPKEERP